MSMRVRLAILATYSAVALPFLSLTAYSLTELALPALFSLSPLLLSPLPLRTALPNHTVSFPFLDHSLSLTPAPLSHYLYSTRSTPPIYLVTLTLHNHTLHSHSTFLKTLRNCYPLITLAPEMEVAPAYLIW